MQAVEDKTARKKKRRLPVVIFIILLLLAALGAAFWYFVFYPKPQINDLSGYSDMPVDLSGNNLIGNLPENLQNGGFIAGQNGWIYYADFAYDGALYMCKPNEVSPVKLTDFPVANINILGDVLVFTGLEKCLAARLDGVVESDPSETSRSAVQGAEHVWYGGKLYAIYGLNSGSEMKLSVINRGTTYFSPYLNKDGLFAFSTLPEVPGESNDESGEDAGEDSGLTPVNVSLEPESDGTNVPDTLVTGQSAISNLLTGVTMPVGKPDEQIVKYFVHGSVIYTELSGPDGGRILRIDAKTLTPLDSVSGRMLYPFESGFVFQNTADGFVYEISPDGQAITPVSAVPVLSMEMTPSGKIIATVNNGFKLVISKELQDTGLPGRALNFWQNVTMQNGWYNYFRPLANRVPVSHPYGTYKANGECYYPDNGSNWHNADNPAGDLAMAEPSSESTVAPEARFRPATSFTPDWWVAGGDINAAVDASDDADDDDWASQFEQSASDDAHNALDAAALLLLKDSSLDSKYSLESVEALRSYYGDSMDMAISAAADELSRAFEAQLGTTPDKQEITEVVMLWLRTAKYRAAGAQIEGDTAQTTLTTSDVVDLTMLASAAETEGTKRVAEKPTLLFMKKEDQTLWAIGLLTEIVKEPKKYKIVNSASVDNIVTMHEEPGVGWVVDDLGVLIDCFIRGMA